MAEQSLPKTHTDPMASLTPRQIVEELDRYIVGQNEAKRAMAVALRNRYRRAKLPAELRDEVMPKNILMIGPTGVGKTEIARRLSRLVKAPFLKVEATKFTEVGYVGRDVDSMVRDLVETSVRMVRQERTAEVERPARAAAEERVARILTSGSDRPKSNFRNPFEMLFSPQGSGTSADEGRSKEETPPEDIKARLRRGEFDDVVIEVDVLERTPSMFDMFNGSGMEELGINMQEMFGNFFPPRRRRQKMTVREALEALTQEEAQKLIDVDEANAEGVYRAEQNGILFLDEIDKIAERNGSYGGPDVSREGVQRDLLPIVEGSTVMTKYGPVRTDHMLFIGAGAFQTAKPSDLIPELQGRFPIRVELSPLTRDDFLRILTEPANALTKQYQALLQVDGVHVEFAGDGLEEIASLAEVVNQQTEDIGARRLQTLVEKVLEDLSFAAPEVTSEPIVINRDYVREKLHDIVGNQDLSRYIL